MIDAHTLRSCVRQGRWVLWLLLAASAPVWAAADLPNPAAPTTAPAAGPLAATPPNAWESTPINRPAESAGKRAETPDGASSAFGLWRLAGSLLIVLVLIFAMRWVARRFLGLPVGRDSAGVIQILCRAALSPKQQLMLIQVGRRLVLVADSGGRMNALCEITDPEEIAALAGQIQQRRSDSATNSFLSQMGRATTQFEGNESPAPESNDSAPNGESVDPALNTMREELGGLLEKVRVLSRHFRQG